MGGYFFKDKTSHMVLEVIKSHVKNRGVGYATKSSCRLAKLRLTLTEIGIILCNRYDSHMTAKALLIFIILRSPRTCIFTSPRLGVTNFVWC